MLGLPTPTAAPEVAFSPFLLLGESHLKLSSPPLPWHSCEKRNDGLSPYSIGVHV